MYHFIMFYLYVKWDEIHFSIFELVQRHDLSLNPDCDPDLGQKNRTFNKNISSHYVSFK